jgi:hypothetical protein
MNSSRGPDGSIEDFAPGEWDRLLAEGEAGGESLDGEQVLAELRELRCRAANEATRKTD